MKENRLQISPTIPSLVDDGDLADDEISIDDQMIHYCELYRRSYK